MEQTLFLFDHIIDIRDAPTGPNGFEKKKRFRNNPSKSVTALSSRAGRDWAGSLRMSIIWTKTNVFCSISHIEKNNSF